jgi:hypothetical protein
MGFLFNFGENTNFFVQFRGYNYFHQPLLMDIDRRPLLASDRPFLREMLSKVGKVMESLVRLLEWNKYA